MSNVEYRRPPLTNYQIAALFHDKRYGIIEASTKSGKTHGALAWLFERAILSQRKHRNFDWIAPVYGQAEVAYNRLNHGLPRGLVKTNYTKLSLTLPNTATLRFKTGEKPDNLYGDDTDDAVIDEASRLREEAWHAVRSTLTKTQGRVRIIGNVKGRKNWFYNLARRAEGGEGDMHYAKIIAHDAVKAGILTQIDIDDARRILPESVFNELYLAIPSEDGGNPFGMKHIAECIEAISLAPAICYGVDLAKSIDWTSIIGLDIAGKICKFERWQAPWAETKTRIRQIVGQTVTLVDSTGVGDPVLEDLQRGDNYHGRFEGYKFTSESKQRLMEGLATGIQQRKTTVLEGIHRMEMESFEYEYTRTGVRYMCPEGLHDDTVCAHALAWSKYSTISSKSPASYWSANNGGPRIPSWQR